jgi:hypothetical protein
MVFAVSSQQREKEKENDDSAMCAHPSTVDSVAFHVTFQTFFFVHPHSAIQRNAVQERIAFSAITEAPHWQDQITHSDVQTPPYADAAFDCCG